MGLPCAICGCPIDYELKTPHPLSYELDEIVPRRFGGSPIDPNNVQPTHRACNRRKYDKEQASERAPKKVKTSNNW